MNIQFVLLSLCVLPISSPEWSDPPHDLRPTSAHLREGDRIRYVAVDGMFASMVDGLNITTVPLSGLHPDLSKVRPSQIAITPNGASIAIAQSGRVLLMEPNGGTPKTILRSVGNEAMITFVSLRRLAVVEGSTLKIVDLERDSMRDVDLANAGLGICTRIEANKSGNSVLLNGPTASVCVNLESFQITPAAAHSVYCGDDIVHFRRIGAIPKRLIVATSTAGAMEFPSIWQIDKIEWQGIGSWTATIAVSLGEEFDISSSPRAYHYLLNLATGAHVFISKSHSVKVFEIHCDEQSPLIKAFGESNGGRARGS